MLLDRRVNRIKFEKEVRRVQLQTALLASRGLFVVGVDYPNIDVLVTAELPLRVSFPFNVPGVPPVAGQIQMGTADFGGASARTFIARIGLEDFDLLAPSVQFLDHRTRTLLPDDQLVLGHLIGENGEAQLVVLRGHQVHKRAFLCVRGIREYHDHPQHTGDDWMLYRGHIGAVDVIDLVWRACVVGVFPHAMLMPNQFLFQWQKLKEKQPELTVAEL